MTEVALTLRADSMIHSARMLDTGRKMIQVLLGGQP